MTSYRLRAYLMRQRRSLPAPIIITALSRARLGAVIVVFDLALIAWLAVHIAGGIA